MMMTMTTTMTTMTTTMTTMTKKAKATMAGRIAELERRLIESEGAAASNSVELAELRRRATVAEATSEALRKELNSALEAKAGDRASQKDVMLRLSEMEREVEMEMHVLQFEGLIKQTLQSW